MNQWFCANSYKFMLFWNPTFHWPACSSVPCKHQVISGKLSCRYVPDDSNLFRNHPCVIISTIYQPYSCVDSHPQHLHPSHLSCQHPCQQTVPFVSGLDWSQKSLCFQSPEHRGRETKTGPIPCSMCNVELFEPVRELALVASTGATRRCFGTYNDKVKRLTLSRTFTLHKKTWECLSLQISAHTTSFIIDGLYGCGSITIGHMHTFTPSHGFSHECLWHDIHDTHDTHDTTEAHLRAEVDLCIGMHTEEEGRLCRHRFLESQRCLYAQSHIPMQRCTWGA